MCVADRRKHLRFNIITSTGSATITGECLLVHSTTPRARLDMNGGLCLFAI